MAPALHTLLNHNPKGLIVTTESQRHRTIRDSNHYLVFLVMLTHHPGRWAVIVEDASNSIIVRLRTGWSEKGFEFVARGHTGTGRVTKIYARFTGTELTNPFPDPIWEEPPPPSQHPIDSEKLLDYARAHPTKGVSELARDLGMQVSSVRRYLQKADLMTFRPKRRGRPRNDDASRNR